MLSTAQQHLHAHVEEQPKSNRHNNLQQTGSHELKSIAPTKGHHKYDNGLRQCFVFGEDPRIREFEAVLRKLREDFQVQITN